MSIADEFPLDDGETIENVEPDSIDTGKGEQTTRVGQGFWAQLKEIGIAEPVLRYSTHLLLAVIVAVVIWSVVKFSWNTRDIVDVEIPQRAALAAGPVELLAAVPDEPAADDEPEPEVKLPVWQPVTGVITSGIPRLAMLHTTIPTRPRVDIQEYIVQSGDTIFGIAEKFGLQPETIFWGNKDSLGDNPHNLRTDQVLNIMPINGTLHKWSAGENFTRVADFYGVEPDVIVEWPGNDMDVSAFDVNNPNLEAGTYLIVPGGTRALIDWGPPRIPRDNPAVASTYGPGYCGNIMDGAVGSGVFIWPTTNHWLSGYDYSPGTNHYGIDIGGNTGDALYAVDAGVVVYSGWSNYGYGYLIVLDHGNGWQSLYGHLSAINVGCGQSVFQGTVIGAMGSTGNSSGPHLHFELMYLTSKVNPWNYLP